MMDELLSPKLDIIFKKLFSENLDLLRDFVSSMLSIPMEQVQNLGNYSAGGSWIEVDTPRR